MDSFEEGRDAEQVFKCTVIAVLHHGEIAKDSQRISKLQNDEDHYNWKRVELLSAIQKIGKFEKDNPDNAVNVLSNSKKSICTV